MVDVVELVLDELELEDELDEDAGVTSCFCPPQAASKQTLAPKSKPDIILFFFIPSLLIIHSIKDTLAKAFCRCNTLGSKNPILASVRLVTMPF